LVLGDILLGSHYGQELHPLFSGAFDGTTLRSLRSRNTSLLDPSNLEALYSFSLKYAVYGLITELNIARTLIPSDPPQFELHCKAVAASVIGASMYMFHPGLLSGFLQNRALHVHDKSSGSATDAG
jgi:hypothetical protein